MGIKETFQFVLFLRIKRVILMLNVNGEHNNLEPNNNTIYTQYYFIIILRETVGGMVDPN